VGLFAYQIRRQIFGSARGRYSVCKNSSLELGRGTKGKGVKFRLINSSVKVGDNCELGFLKITAINSDVQIGYNTKFFGHSHINSKDSLIKIGDNTRFFGNADITSLEGCNISIGKNCLFADGCWITTSDHHVVQDTVSGEQLNAPQSVKIEDEVWLGREVVVLKGVVIGMGSAIGVRSVVTKQIPSHCLAVGIPAKPIKNNIRWS
jgi:acetyltransferase-like isoleucine patch superfamily enzyme